MSNFRHIIILAFFSTCAIGQNPFNIIIDDINLQRAIGIIKNDNGYVAITNDQGPNPGVYGVHLDINGQLVETIDTLRPSIVNPHASTVESFYKSEFKDHFLVSVLYSHSWGSSYNIRRINPDFSLTEVIPAVVSGPESGFEFVDLIQRNGIYFSLTNKVSFAPSPPE